MIKIIICPVCKEKLGEIDKDEISQEDMDMYLLITKCSSGHGVDLREPEAP